MSLNLKSWDNTKLMFFIKAKNSFKNYIIDYSNNILNLNYIIDFFDIKLKSYKIKRNINNLRK